MTRKLYKNGTGGSKKITFPKAVLLLAHLDKENEVNIEVQKDKIIIKKVGE